MWKHYYCDSHQYSTDHEEDIEEEASFVISVDMFDNLTILDSEFFVIDIALIKALVKEISGKEWTCCK